MALKNKFKEADVLGHPFILKFMGLIWIIFFIIFYLCTRPRLSAYPVDGESICFILGEDKKGHQFYELAAEHFREDAQAKTDQLVSHIRSIEDLILYLNANPPATSYDRIELVVHGNVWSGLSIKILDGGERAYPKELLKAILKNQLPQLDAGVIDSSTKVNVWGCGIGKNPIIKIALDSLFKDASNVQASVNPSGDFVIFKRVHPHLPAKKIQANYWPYFFKRGYRPSESEIIHAFKKQYPEEKINWELSLARQTGKEKKGTFEQNFHVPISWIVVYDKKSDRPSVSTEEEKMNWIISQPGLVQRIRDFEIPIDKYTWTVNKIIHTDDNGNKVPAIKAIGMSTVLCVLELEESVI